MKCKTIRYQIIENPLQLPPLTLKHIKNCKNCNKLYYEYINFEKLMQKAKESAPNPTSSAIQPNYLINLVSLREKVQKKLNYFKRVYILTTIAFILLIYSLLLNTFSTPQNNFEKSKKENITYVSKNAEENLFGELAEELAKAEEEWATEIFDVLDHI